MVTLKASYVYSRGLCHNLGVIQMVYQYWAATVALRRCFSRRILLDFSACFFFFLSAYQGVIYLFFISNHSQRCCSLVCVILSQKHVDITEIKCDFNTEGLRCVNAYGSKSSFVMLFSVVQKDLDKNVQILLFVFYIHTQDYHYYLSFIYLSLTLSFSQEFLFKLHLLITSFWCRNIWG